MVFVGLGVAGMAGLVWIAIAGVLALSGRARPRLVLVTAAAVWIADLLTLAIKETVDRPRPYVSIAEVDRLMGAVGSSFPSGHAATSAAGFAVLAIAVPRLAPAFAGLAAAIAFSRIYVGVHYPTDVLAGMAIGAAVGAATAWLTLLRSPGTVRPRRPRDRPRG